MQQINNNYNNNNISNDNSNSNNNNNNNSNNNNNNRVQKIFSGKINLFGTSKFLTIELFTREAFLHSVQSKMSLNKPNEWSTNKFAFLKSKQALSTFGTITQALLQALSFVPPSR